MYRLHLSDKNNNGYNIDNPGQFLTQRAITRRINQNIAITQSDLPITKTYTDSLQKLGCEIIAKSKWFNTVVIATTDTALLDTIQNLSFVDTLERFTEGNKIQTSKPDKNIQSTEDYYDYGNAYNQIHIHNGEIMHNNGYRGQGMRIAVIDAGFTGADQIQGFQHIFSDNRLIATYDFINRNSNVFGFHSHGTNVLSCIASYLPGEFVGTAPEAEFLLLRSENGSSEYEIEEDFWVAAAEFADSLGVDVISSSLGYNTFNDSRQNYTYQDMDGKTAMISKAATIASEKGILVVVSAGNAGNDSWHYITAPADADSIITVGAISSSLDIASFSSRGPSSDGRIKPDIVAKGLAATVLSTTGDITTNSGTSFSAPIAAGLATCLWQANPEKNNIEIINLIKEYSSQYEQPDNIKGYGIPDFGEALSVSVLGGNISKDKFLYLSENPFNDKIKFSFYSSAYQDVYVTISDITGKIIYSQTYKAFKQSKQDFNINANSLNAGVYIIKIVSDQSKFDYKIMKL